MILVELKKNLEINQNLLFNSWLCSSSRREILLKKEKYIDAVIGPQSYHQINDMILKLEKKSKPINLQSLM